MPVGMDGTKGMSMNDHLCRIKIQQMSSAEMHRHFNTGKQEKHEAVGWTALYYSSFMPYGSEI